MVNKVWSEVKSFVFLWATLNIIFFWTRLQGTTLCDKASRFCSEGDNEKRTTSWMLQEIRYTMDKLQRNSHREMFPPLRSQERKHATQTSDQTPPPCTSMSKKHNWLPLAEWSRKLLCSKEPDPDLPTCHAAGEMSDLLFSSSRWHLLCFSSFMFKLGAHSQSTWWRLYPHINFSVLRDQRRKRKTNSAFSENDTIFCVRTACMVETVIISTQWNIET